MKTCLSIISLAFILLLSAIPLRAQDQTWDFVTVDRPPFSDTRSGEHVGFSVDLIRAIAKDLGKDVTLTTADSFGDMLDQVAAGTVDGAIANFSITAAREEMLDFTQPIFESGLKVMVPQENAKNSIFRAIFRKEILYAGLISIGLLFSAGFLMWVFERRKQPYFDRPLKEAIFPSFWWALNLVVNGGFEERMPQSRPGRVFSVVLVFASLFVVSFFVATITATVTVDALQENISSLNDLDNKVTGTIEGSTAASLLASRDIAYEGFGDPQSMFTAFEEKTLDAVVFDAPILAYYVATKGRGTARLLPRNYRPENYGIALPSGSPLREQINQSLLRLRENGTYETLIDKWFGAGYRP